MHKNLRKVIIFASGVIVGSVTTYIFIREKYKRYADAEIASVKERFTVEKAPEPELEGCNDDISDEESTNEEHDVKSGSFIRSNDNDTSDEELTDEELVDREYRKIDDKEGEVSYMEKLIKVLHYDPGPNDPEPFILEPGEFGVFDDYTMLTFKHYAEDNITLDENGNILDPDDVEIAVGYDAIDMLAFDESIDVLYVRNPTLKIDFEIYRIPETYPITDGDTYNA